MTPIENTVFARSKTTHDATARVRIAGEAAGWGIDARLNYHWLPPMRVYLVHHGDALGPDVDPQRPLSTRGLAQAVHLADQTRAAGAAPAAIWHSGKLRARQTAEPFLRLNPFAEFKMVRGLRPDDPPEMMRDLLRSETRDLVLVGHMPNLADLLQLVTGNRGFPLHGLVALQRDKDQDEWRETWRTDGQ